MSVKAGEERLQMLKNRNHGTDEMFPLIRDQLQSDVCSSNLCDFLKMHLTKMDMCVGAAERL